MKTILFKKAFPLRLAAYAAFVLISGSVCMNSNAGTATTSFTVGGTVTASCTMTSTALSFGTTINIFGANVDSTSTITATCTNGAAYDIGLDAGQGASATVSTRKMTHTNGTDTLNYSLSSVASGGTNWEDSGGAGLATGTGSGSGQAITVYGRIPTGQTSTLVGTYLDTIVATVNF